MKKLLLLLMILSSCASNETLSKYNRISEKDQTTVCFDIYNARGYFYKGKGFMVIQRIPGEQKVIVRCTLDSLKVID